MKIQRFVAKDSRQAMREVREAMGGDAVILSSQRVDKGIEVVAAVDYDEQLLQARLRDGSLADMLPQQQASARAAMEEDSFNEMRRELTQLRNLVENGLVNPSQKNGEKAAVKAAAKATDKAAEKAVNKVAEPSRKEAPAEPRKPVAAKTPEPSTPEPSIPEPSTAKTGNPLFRKSAGKGGTSKQRTALLSRLLNLGLGRDLSLQLADKAPLGEGLESSWNYSMKYLSAQLQEGGNQILSTGGCVALVGPTGVGKTTSVAKLAARFAMRHGRNQVALITTDCYRIGGQEQIYTFGRILGVPVRLATNREELSKAIDEFSERRLVMIDTAGMSQRDMELMQQFKTLQGAAPDMQVYLTLSATSQLPILNEVISKFGISNLAGAIVTKVDETASLGPALSALVRHRLPAAYIGNGQRVPEDIQLARASGMVKDAQQLMATYGREASDWQQLNNDIERGRAVNAGVA